MHASFLSSLFITSPCCVSVTNYAIGENTIWRIQERKRSNLRKDKWGNSWSFLLFSICHTPEKYIGIEPRTFSQLSLVLRVKTHTLCRNVMHATAARDQPAFLTGVVFLTGRSIDISRHSSHTKKRANTYDCSSIIIWTLVNPEETEFWGPRKIYRCLQ